MPKVPKIKDFNHFIKGLNYNSEFRSLESPPL